MSEGTEVMTIGAIPAGMPSPGGPVPTYSAPWTQPTWLYNAEARLPPSWDVPQNLPRVTAKGCRNCGPASTGKPITSALAGLNAPCLGALTVGDAEAAAASGGDVFCMTRAGAAYVAATQVGYTLLGATFAGIHGYRRTGGSGGWTALWAVAGGLFPIVTGIVAVAQGYGKKS